MALNGCHLVIARSFMQVDVDVDDEWCEPHLIRSIFVVSFKPLFKHRCLMVPSC